MSFENAEDCSVLFCILLCNEIQELDQSADTNEEATKVQEITQTCMNEAKYYTTILWYCMYF